MYTFRKWNPEKKNVPFGVTTDVDEVGESSALSWIRCFMCNFAAHLSREMFSEHIDVAQDGKLIAT